MILIEVMIMNKFKKFMLHNDNMIDVLYFGTSTVFMIVLPLLIGVITDSGFICYLAILVGMILTLTLSPVIDKIVDKYIIGL